LPKKKKTLDEERAVNNAIRAFGEHIMRAGFTAPLSLKRIQDLIHDILGSSNA